MASLPAGVTNINDLLDKEDVDEIFTLEEEIASGSFGTVYKGTHVPTGKTIAIKIITPDEDEVPEDLMIEIAFLKQVDHPNIIKYFGGYRKGDEIFISMELCSCCARDIFEYSDDPLKENEIALIMHESLKGLEYMHQNNFIHRDIKAANILVTNTGGVKLIDFGVSSLNGKNAKTFVGTPYWMAPELIDSKNGLSSYDEKVDIWSIGITCIELAETIPPLSYINPMRALFQIPVRESPVLEKKEKWSPLFNDFIAQCLEKNPKKRPNATELLQHPFVRDCDKDPQILLNLIKRKEKLENNYESDDSDFSDEFLDSSEISSQFGMDISIDSPAPERKNGTSSPVLADPLEKPKIAPPERANSDFGVTTNFLSTPAPKPPAEQAPLPPPMQFASSEANLNSMVQSLDKPEPKQASASSPVLPETPKPFDRKAGSSLLTPQKVKTTKPSERPANRPTHTLHRKTNKHKDLHQRGNKRMIKQQMAYMNDLNQKLQKKVAKQEKKQQQEKDSIIEGYKRQMETNTKTFDAQRKNIERQQKIETDGLLKAQRTQRKQLLREHDTQDKALQKEIRDDAKNLTKTHTNNQKNRLKEQKLTLKQSKKLRSKADLQLLGKEHKFEIQLGEKIHTFVLTRNQVFKQKELEWQQQISRDTQEKTETDHRHQQEVEFLQQMITFECEGLDQQFNLRMEEQQKIQPLEQKHQRERFELQQQNLKQQLQVEREHQMKLLLADQKLIEKKHLKDKKELAKQSENEVKKLLKGSSKAEVRELKQTTKDKLVKTCTELDLKFKSLIESQKIEEEESISMFQQRTFNQLKERQEEARNDLEKAHAKQQAELQQEELQARTVLTNEHHSKEQSLLEKQHTELDSQLAKQHQTKSELLHVQQQQIMELLTNQQQELFDFITANQSKMLPGSPQTFKDSVVTHFAEVIELRNATHAAAKQELAALLEREDRDLKQKLFEQKQSQEERQKAEKERLAQLAQTTATAP